MLSILTLTIALAAHVNAVSVHTDPLNGQACIAWGFPSEEMGVDCWPIAVNGQRTFERTLPSLRCDSDDPEESSCVATVWYVQASEHGTDAAGKRVDKKTDRLQLQVEDSWLVAAFRRWMPIIGHIGTPTLVPFGF
jgi:hypothetical protein